MTSIPPTMSAAISAARSARPSRVSLARRMAFRTSTSAGGSSAAVAVAAAVTRRRAERRPGSARVQRGTCVRDVLVNAFTVQNHDLLALLDR